MFYFGLYWVSAAVYGICLMLWCTANSDIVDEVLSEFELDHGVSLNYNKCICFSILLGSVIWPIGTIAIMIVKIYYFIQKQKHLK